MRVGPRSLLLVVSGEPCHRVGEFLFGLQQAKRVSARVGLLVVCGSML